jgi:hypothetical protein
MIDNQRQIDLLRYARHLLHDAELISNEEYAWLLSEQPGAVGRLERYDASRIRINELNGQLVSAKERIQNLEAELVSAEKQILSYLEAERDELVSELF